MIRRVARRDDNEASIVDALRRAGALVFRLSERDLPDLLVGFRERWLLLEVKAPAGPRGGTKGHHAVLRPGQEEFFALAAAASLPVAIARSARDALLAIGLNVGMLQ